MASNNEEADDDADLAEAAWRAFREGLLSARTLLRCLGDVEGPGSTRRMPVRARRLARCLAACSNYHVLQRRAAVGLASALAAAATDTTTQEVVLAHSVCERLVRDVQPTASLDQGAARFVEAVLEEAADRCPSAATTLANRLAFTLCFATRSSSDAGDNEGTDGTGADEDAGLVAIATFANGATARLPRLPPAWPDEARPQLQRAESESPPCAGSSVESSRLAPSRRWRRRMAVSVGRRMAAGAVGDLCRAALHHTQEDSPIMSNAEPQASPDAWTARRPETQWAELRWVLLGAASRSPVETSHELTDRLRAELCQSLVPELITTIRAALSAGDASRVVCALLVSSALLCGFTPPAGQPRDDDSKPIDDRRIDTRSLSDGQRGHPRAAWWLERLLMAESGLEDVSSSTSAACSLWHSALGAPSYSQLLASVCFQASLLDSFSSSVQASSSSASAVAQSSTWAAGLGLRDWELLGQIFAALTPHVGAAVARSHAQVLRKAAARLVQRAGASTTEGGAEGDFIRRLRDALRDVADVCMVRCVELDGQVAIEPQGLILGHRRVVAPATTSRSTAPVVAPPTTAADGAAAQRRLSGWARAAKRPRDLDAPIMADAEPMEPAVVIVEVDDDPL